MLSLMLDPGGFAVGDDLTIAVGTEKAQSPPVAGTIGTSPLRIDDLEVFCKI